MNRELKPSWKTGELHALLLSLAMTVAQGYFGVSEDEAVQMVTNVTLGAITLAGMVSFVLGRHNVKVAWIEYLKTLPPPKDLPLPVRPAAGATLLGRNQRLDDIERALAELRELITASARKEPA